jgi:hypothetical protein
MEQKEAGSNPPNVKLWELQSHRKGKCRIPNQTSAAIPWLQVIQAPSSAKLCTFAVQELVKNGAAMQKQPKDTRFCWIASQAWLLETQQNTAGRYSPHG